MRYMPGVDILGSRGNVSNFGIADPVGEVSLERFERE